jgi:hypothetical protein
MENKVIVGAVVSTKTTGQEEVAALLPLGKGRLVSVEECPAVPAQPLTKQQMLDRVSVLSDEIDANEEENRVMQAEINDLYRRLDTLGTHLNRK